MMVAMIVTAVPPAVIMVAVAHPMDMGPPPRRAEPDLSNQRLRRLRHAGPRNGGSDRRARKSDAGGEKRTSNDRTHLILQRRLLSTPQLSVCTVDCRCSALVGPPATSRPKIAGVTLPCLHSQSERTLNVLLGKHSSLPTDRLCGRFERLQEAAAA